MIDLFCCPYPSSTYLSVSNNTSTSLTFTLQSLIDNQGSYTLNTTLSDGATSQNIPFSGILDIDSYYNDLQVQLTSTYSFSMVLSVTINYVTTLVSIMSYNITESS